MTQHTRLLFFISLVLMFTACSAGRGVTTKQEDLPAAAEAPEKKEVTETDRLRSTSLLIDASKQKILGNYERAVEIYHEALKKDPQNDAVYFELSKVYVMYGNYEQSLEYAVKAVELDPGNAFYQILLADIHILRDDVQKARSIYEHLTASEPDNVAFQEKLLSVYIYNDDYDKAILLINHIEQIAGFSQTRSVKKLQILLELDRFDEAIGEAEKMIGYFPEETIFYELLGELYTETGQLDKAKDVYFRLLKEDPEAYMPHLLLADHFLAQDNPERAYYHIREAFDHPELDVDSKTRIIFTYLFYAEEDEKYIEKAFELAQILLEKHPDDPEAFFVYGDLLSRSERWEDARDIYLQGARLDPSNLLVWQQILNLDLRLGDYEKMRKHSEMSLEYFFEQPILFLFNGLANMQLKDYETAASSLEYGLAITIDDEELQEDFYSMLGDVYHFLGIYEESNRYYESAIALNPDNATALNNYSYHLSVRNERLDEALRMSEKANTLDPENPAFLDTQGWIKYRMGKYREAEKWIRLAIELSKEPGAVILEHYGDVQYKLGNKEEAFKFWQKAKKAGDGSDFLHKKIKDRTLYE